MKTFRKTQGETRGTETVDRNFQVNLRRVTINLGTLIGRTAEVVETLSRRNVDIAVIQEERPRRKGARLV